jgi:hypothetical protein
VVGCLVGLGCRVEGLVVVAVRERVEGWCCCQVVLGCCWVVRLGWCLVGLVRAAGLHQVAAVVVMEQGCCGLEELGWLLVVQGLSRCPVLGCLVVLGWWVQEKDCQCLAVCCCQALGCLQEPGSRCPHRC